MRFFTPSVSVNRFRFTMMVSAACCRRVMKTGPRSKGAASASPTASSCGDRNPGRESRPPSTEQFTNRLPRLIRVQRNFWASVHDSASLAAWCKTAAVAIADPTPRRRRCPLRGQQVHRGQPPHLPRRRGRARPCPAQPRLAASRTLAQTSRLRRRHPAYRRSAQPTLARGL